MKILVINPNSTKSMTELIASEARRIAGVNTEIVAVNPSESPAAIEGPADGEAATPHLISLFSEITSNENFDATVIACFDDTGLWELKQRSDKPVIGIGEAGYHAAMLAGMQFSVVTTLPVSVPILEQNLVDQGMSKRCGKVRATNIPVLELEANREASTKRISDEIELALQEDGSDAIVLGCAGMADIAAMLEQKHKVPVIDGVKAAICLCETLYRIRA